jgi:hypothetical protein
MVRRAAVVAVLVLGAAVSLASAVRRRAGNGAARNGSGHAHHCFLCEGEWHHRGPCATERSLLCPWCLAGSRAGAGTLPERIASALQEIGPARRGRHVHRCPRCLTTWTHRGTGNGTCTADDRAALPECPGCQRRKPRGPTALPRA